MADNQHSSDANDNQTQLTVDDAYEQAIEHFNAQRYTEADQLCTAIIQAVPNYIDAINLLGIIAQKLNRHDLAIEQFQQAINIDNSRALFSFNLGVSFNKLSKLDEAISSYQKATFLQPDYVHALGNLGSVLKEMGKLDEALTYYQKAISIEPHCAEVHNNIGNIFREKQRFDEAISSYQKAISLKPNDVYAFINLGIILQEQGRLDEAIASHQKTISIEPDHADAHFNIGIILQEQAKLDEAVDSYQKAILIEPDHADAYFNLGNALHGQDKPDAAVTSYQKAISIKADYSDAYFNIGCIQQEQGKQDKAIASYQKAISIKPRYGLYWAGFAQCVKSVNISYCDEDFFLFLLQMLEQPSIRPNDVSAVVIRALHHHPGFSHILGIFKSDHINDQAEYLTEQLSTIPLLLRLMELSVVVDLSVEKILTEIRHILLTEVIGGKNDIQGIEFYIALAMHCFTNEYVYSESKEEQQNIAYLQEKIALLLEENETVPLKLILVFSAYRPLYRFSWSDELLNFEYLNDMEKVFERQIKEPRKEQFLRSEIPRLALIDDTISKAVRDQYEENPYPRWINVGLRDTPRTIKEALKELKLTLKFHDRQLSDKPDILIAGCGTGLQSSSTASNFLNCSVLAFDLSLSSLSYAKRKALELGLSNIEFMQGDILQLNSLERTFDIIESTGVLHHMDDPIAGWKVLVDILRPNGLMKIGLYSDLGRQGVVEARALIAEKKYTTSPEDIRRCRSEIINMASDSDAVIAKNLNSIDFYSMSECRDLLFHVQEHRFTLPQIKAALQDLGLHFLGFELQHNRVMKEFSKLYPEKTAHTSLSLWNKFEIQNPDTFSGMYQFWVQKM